MMQQSMWYIVHNAAHIIWYMMIRRNMFPEHMQSTYHLVYDDSPKDVSRTYAKYRLSSIWYRVSFLNSMKYFQRSIRPFKVM